MYYKALIILHYLVRKIARGRHEILNGFDGTLLLLFLFFGTAGVLRVQRKPATAFYIVENFIKQFTCSTFIMRL